MNPNYANQDIGNYKNVDDLVYILLAVLIVDIIVIFLVRYFPEVFGKSLNSWYNDFGLNAVLADVFILFLGFVITRYVYTIFIKDQYAGGKWSLLLFVGTLVVVQFIHDILFYVGVIEPIPRGHNAMIDIFKNYSSGGLKIVIGDALMMASSVAIAIFLKAQPSHVVASVGALSVYTLPYILYTNNKYT
jgi:hypothetical protein